MRNTRSSNLLVADDDAIVSEGTAKQLSRLGYTVLEQPGSASH